MGDGIKAREEIGGRKCNVKEKQAVLLRGAMGRGLKEAAAEIGA